MGPPIKLKLRLNLDLKSKPVIPTKVDSHWQFDTTMMTNQVVTHFVWS